MKNKFTQLSTAFVLAAIVVWSVGMAEEHPDRKKGKGSLEKTAGTPRYTILNINNLTTWHRSDGQSNHSPQADNGMEYPRNTGNVIYQDGVVWGGKLFTGGFEGTGTPVSIHQVRVGGGTYGVGTRAGYVSGTPPVAANPNDADVRIFRIRRDYTTLKNSDGTFTDDLRRDAADVNEIQTPEVTDAQMSAVYDQYNTDWGAWPVNRGAPYIERNGVSGYQAPPAFGPTFTVDSLISGNYDEPGIAGVDPSSPADQVIYTVFNDLNEATALLFVSSESIGLEVQKTVWGYKRSDAMGNLYFQRYRLINKGGVDIDPATSGFQGGSFYVDSMFVCQWSDPDLGSFSDDLAGCDSARSMGFIYNGNAQDATFRAFSLAPPAAGYDFLAGPVVAAAATDTAIFDLKQKPGYRNLGMSSFAYFSAGSPYSDPPNNVPGGYAGTTGQWWKMLRGFAPLGTITDKDTVYNHAPGATITKYPLSGDPAQPSSATNFIDGQGTLYSFAPGDRRILLNTGPFQLAPGDTQEIYIGVVVGIGGDNLSSVAVMKANDNAVQNTFDLRFQVSKAPAAPIVNVTELDGEVILEWGSSLARVNETENTISQPGGYTFEGYNVYQLSGRGQQISAAKRVVVYDKPVDPRVVFDTQFDPVSGQFIQIPIQFGTNAGVKRSFRLDRDYVRGIEKLYNGQEYYVAITAYSIATQAGFTAALESSPQVITVRPKAPFGAVMNAAYGDTVTVSRSAGQSDGSAAAYVIDPRVVTGNAYEVRFDTTGGNTTWLLYNTTKNQTVVSGQTNQAGEGVIADGIEVRVSGPPLAGKTYSYASASPANLSPVAVAEQGYTGGRWFTGGSHGGEIFFGGVFMEPNFWGATTLGPTDYKTVQLRFSPMQSYTDLNGDGTYTIGEPYVVTGPHIQNAFRYRTFSGAAYLGFNPIPFTAWDITNPATPVQLNVVLRDRDQNGQWDLHANTGDPAIPNGGDQQFNYVWITNTPYDATGTYYGNGTGGARDFFDALGGTAVDGGMWVMWVDDRGNGGMLAEECRFTLFPNLVNAAGDRFAFNTASFKAMVGNAALEKNSAERVGVFPNPYYAFNAAETNRFSRFVTFNNLSPKATIRIFNLAGQLVRRLEKDDNTQFMRWDLANLANFPIASGIYIAHVEMTLPTDGSKVTKVLKFAVIQEQEILNSY